jgi:hypothetical protein
LCFADNSASGKSIPFGQRRETLCVRPTGPCYHASHQIDHLKAQGDEQTGSQSYIPPDPKDDKALHTAHHPCATAWAMSCVIKRAIAHTAPV